MFRLTVPVLSMTATTLLLGGAPTMLASGSAVAKTAELTHRHRGAHARLHRHASAPVIAAAPYGVPLDEVGPNHYPNNGGEDELGLADGVRLGREGTPGPRNYPGIPVYSTSSRGFDIEGPPIYPALPVLPELVDPALTR